MPKEKTRNEDFEAWIRDHTAHESLVASSLARQLFEAGQDTERTEIVKAISELRKPYAGAAPGTTGAEIDTALLTLAATILNRGRG